ncbi:MAG: metallophosphoesterase [Ruminococcus sp.]|nr:metallophosphoesterase [Ruminococcus sp.]
MGIWRFVIIGVSIVLVLSILYLIARGRRISIVKKISEKSKLLGALCGFWPVVICLPLLIKNLYAFVIALIHLCLIWALCDLIGFIIRKVRKKEKRESYITGYIAVGITVCYLTVGWFFAHHVFRTEYTLKTAKELGADSLRIVAIADSHLGMTLDGDDFAEQCRRINEEKPDAVVVVGDFVDDESEREDMIKAAEALGSIETTYGVFWVYGNHDRGYYRHRNFEAAELTETLEKNGVKVLTDTAVPLGDNICLIGRLDKSFGERKSASELMQGIDSSKYVIMLDHQPNDYDAEATAGADLVISGHTHGGHIFPAGAIGLITKSNDRIYGTETRGETTFLVTSGISGWGIPFKTFAISEYVVIDIAGK